MSRINDVVQRAISDGAFRAQLRSDPARALRGFSLSPDETQALTGGALLSVGSWLFIAGAFAAAYLTAPIVRRAWT